MFDIYTTPPPNQTTTPPPQPPRKPTCEGDDWFAGCPRRWVEEPVGSYAASVALQLHQRSLKVSDPVVIRKIQAVLATLGDLIAVSTPTSTSSPVRNLQSDRLQEEEQIEIDERLGKMNLKLLSIIASSPADLEGITQEFGRRFPDQMSQGQEELTEMVYDLLEDWIYAEVIQLTESGQFTLLPRA